RSKNVLVREHSEPLFVLLHTYFVQEYYINDSDLAGNDFDSRNDWNKHRIEKAHQFGKDYRGGDVDSAVAVRDMYAAKAGEFDSYLFEFLRWLETTPLAGNLSVILTSDHGEGLFDDQDGKTVYGHCGAPYPERVRVPLSFSGLEPGQRDDLISLRELSGVIEDLARHGELRLPDLQTIETEFLTAEREDEVKFRHSSIVSADGTWTMEEAPGSSLDDSREVPPIDKEHLRQLRILGYVQ
ncbi:MAG: sulfatase-like hydrolase/transferase, partial [Acidobacteriota bacterium]